MTNSVASGRTNIPDSSEEEMIFRKIQKELVRPLLMLEYKSFFIISIRAFLKPKY